VTTPSAAPKTTTTFSRTTYTQGPITTTIDEGEFYDDEEEIDEDTLESEDRSILDSDLLLNLQLNTDMDTDMDVGGGNEDKSSGGGSSSSNQEKLLILKSKSSNEMMESGEGPSRNEYHRDSSQIDRSNTAAPASVSLRQQPFSFIFIFSSVVYLFFIQLVLNFSCSTTSLFCLVFILFNVFLSALTST
jgi:hypothetical protein